MVLMSLFGIHPAISRYYHFKWAAEQQNCDPAADAQCGQHKEEGFPGHPRPERTEKA